MRNLVKRWSDRATGVLEKAFGFVGCAGLVNVTARHPLFTALTWNEAADAMLGKKSDQAVAQELGIHAKTVARRRRLLNIPVFKAPHVWTADEDRQLGVVSDREVGRRLNLNVKAVRARRLSLNIAAWRQPPHVLIITCVICGRKTKVSGRRASQLRQTCLPPHPFTRPRQLSDHHKQLISAVQKITRNQSMSARKLVKRTVGHGVVDLLGD